MYSIQRLIRYWFMVEKNCWLKLLPRKTPNTGYVYSIKHFWISCIVIFLWFHYFYESIRTFQTIHPTLNSLHLLFSHKTIIEEPYEPSTPFGLHFLVVAAVDCCCCCCCTRTNEQTDLQPKHHIYLFIFLIIFYLCTYLLICHALLTLFW